MHGRGALGTRGCGLPGLGPKAGADLGRADGSGFQPWPFLARGSRMLCSSSSRRALLDDPLQLRE
eukprot:9421554-Pyramimonas_sp.AAC.1